uniref:RING-type E3 ubiquitin transferase n=1 Tax=Opuntia streptacantha TaxID=393608 RepID=A0A7C8ZYT8_OPUST
MARTLPHHRHLLEISGGGIIASPPPTTGTRPGGGPYGSEATFDTNMVIILAALLCALICALGLNSIVRCVLRCTGRLVVSNHEPSDRSEAVGSRVTVGCRGLKRSTLRQIPVSIYEKSPSGKGNNINDVISTDCIICLGEFMDGDKIRVLPKCKHGFHVRCIDVWLLSHSSCPTCRQSVSDWADLGGGNGRDSSQDDNVNVNGNVNTRRQGPSEVVITIPGEAN